jgi:hypothetical protein
VRAVPAKLLLLLFALALLAGCSTLQLAYDNAGRYLYWRATSYLDLNGEGLEALGLSIERFHAWHRARALPEYARLAEEAAGRLAGGLSREDLVWGYDALIAQARRGLRQAAEEAAPVLDGLDAAQLEHLEKRFAADNRRFAREHLRGTPEERRNKRTRRTQERLEDWVGKLAGEQAARVRQYSERAPLVDEMRARERKRLQGDLLALLRERRAAEQLPARAERWERGRDPAYEAAVAAQRREYFAMLLEIDRMLTPEQRARAVRQVQRYAGDFRRLAAKAPGQLASQ